MSVITEDRIKDLYRTWLIEKAKFENRQYRLPKDYKKNKRMWSIFTKLAAILDGSPVDPAAYMRACLHGIKNCHPSHLISERGVDAFERFHNLQVKDMQDNPIQGIGKSLNWVLEFCEKEGIQPNEYLFYEKGKSRCAVIHLDIGNLSPYLLLVYPGYERFIDSLDPEDQRTVAENILEAYYHIKKNPERFDLIRVKLQTTFGG